MSIPKLASLLAICVIFPTLAYASPICGNSPLKTGDLIGLSETRKGLCWKHLRGKVLEVSELQERGGNIRLAYVFGESRDVVNFDPIMHVKELLPSKDESGNVSSIRLVRRAMKTLCRENPEFPNIDGLKVSAVSYNKYHLEIDRKIKPTADKGVLNFHIKYKPSSGQCILTNSLKIRATFGIDDLITSGSNPVVAAVNEFFCVKNTLASGLRYSSIEVEIVKGEDESGFSIGKWSAPAQVGLILEIRDISNYTDGFGPNPKIKRTLN
jgi:hypothetical protein